MATNLQRPTGYNVRAGSERLAQYRAEIRRTFQAFSDEALAYQDARIVGGIDREECDREKARRGR